MTELTAIDRIKLALAEKASEKYRNELLLAGGCSLDTHPTKHNWVEDAGGLPEYICNIAKDILESGSTKDVGRAISIAVGRCKVWAAGGGGVKADTRAKAAAAIAEWEKKKASAHAKVKASGVDIDLDDEVEFSAVEILAADVAARKLDRK